jgi:hypothetical protein
LADGGGPDVSLAVTVSLDEVEDAQLCLTCRWIVIGTQEPETLRPVLVDEADERVIDGSLCGLHWSILARF